MSLAEEVARRTQDAPVRLVAGQVIADPATGVLSVNVAGGGGTPRWADGYIPVAGDPVLVALSGLEAWVICRVGAGPSVETGTVQTIPGGATITVDIAGTSTACRFASTYTPTVGDLVQVLRQSSQPFVVAKVGTVAAPAPVAAPAAPPPATTGGIDVFPATGAGSWRDGQWRTDTGDVVQGDAPGYTGHPNNGAWFYGTAPKVLDGATVTKADIWLPGDSSSVSSPAIHLYRHTSNNRPSGDVSRVAGPFDVTKGGRVSGWYPFNVAAAQAIVDSGGGVGITGSPYARHKGLSKDGQSGALRFQWTR